MRPVVILAIGVLVGGGVAAVGLDWRAAPASAAGPGGSTWRGAELPPRGADDGVPASSGPDESSSLEGTVLETIDASRYTYLRLDVGQGHEAWAAVSKAPVPVGARIRVTGAVVMRDFHSSSLKRTFDEIYFGELGDAKGTMAAGSPHGATAGQAPAQEIPVGKVKPAEGELGRTIAQIVEQAAKLDGKRVRVRGVVVKSTVGVLDRNWLHLRDNSASPPGADDLLVTTTDEASLGQTVLVEGTVSTKKDFGAGYSYEILVENAVIQVSP